MAKDHALTALAAFAAALTPPVLGVSVSAAGTALLGTLVAGAWAEPIDSKGRLALVVVGSSVLACFTVAVLPAFDLNWAKAAPQGPLCGVLAVVYRLWLAAVTKRGGQLISSFNPLDWLPSRKTAVAAAVEPLPAEAAKPLAPPES